MTDHPTARNLLPWLDRLEAQWVRLNAPIAGLLNPGLDEDAINDLTEPYGLTLPPEWTAWWQWHDGAGLWPSSANDNSVTIGPGTYEFLPLSGALAKYEFSRGAHPESEPEGHVWRANWLPFMTQGAERLYVDCADVMLHGHSPVKLVSWEWEMPTVARAWSLTHAVTLWVWLLESDYYWWEADAPIPHWARRDLPEFADWTGLA